MSIYKLYLFPSKQVMRDVFPAKGLELNGGEEGLKKLGNRLVHLPSGKSLDFNYYAPNSVCINLHKQEDDGWVANYTSDCFMLTASDDMPAVADEYEVTNKAHLRYFRNYIGHVFGDYNTHLDTE